MKLIIAGSRSLDTETTYLIEKALCILPDQGISEVVSGNARGIDQLGAQWARFNKIPVSLFLAEWEVYGKRAGFLRNERMAKHGDALLAIWDGQSKGTKHMIDIMTKEGKPVYVYRTDENN